MECGVGAFLRGRVPRHRNRHEDDGFAESVAALSGLGIRYALGRHDEADFSGADLVIKNPAVRPDNCTCSRRSGSRPTCLCFYARPARIAAVTAQGQVDHRDCDGGCSLAA